MLSVKNLLKLYGSVGQPSVRAIDDVSFEVEEGEILSLLGPSGCGKTTTLQCIAGLATPTAGEIRMGGDVVYSSDRSILVPANRRRLGMVFQSYAIWPHMSVFDNVAFPIVHGVNRLPADQVRLRVLEALELVQMGQYADRPAPHLSGGQQQRIALARAIVHRPRILLLDEPLSNLDAKLREVMRIELRRLIKMLGITAIFVTHDQVEAMSMSDRILLLKSGRIMQAGTPREIYLRPENAFTADFMGRSNLVPAVVRDAAEGVVEASFGQVRCSPPVAFANQSPVSVAIRPQMIGVSLPESGTAELGQNQFRARISAVSFCGDMIEGEAELQGQKLRVCFDPYLDAPVGAEVILTLGRERCVVVPSEQLPSS